jgi:hypothetical protein
MSSEPCKKRYNNPSIKCSHRTSYATVDYRPLIPLLISIVEDEEFRAALSFKHEDIDYKEQDMLVDILNSDTWLKHKEQMHLFFERKKSLSEVDIEEISLCLSFNYDGVQPFRRRSISCSPLGITIHNLPPIWRAIMGMGTYILSILTESDEKACAPFCRGVEHFIIRDCLVEELISLYYGINLTLQSGKIVYLQARFLQLVCDGVQNQSTLKMQGHNSKAGCGLCGEMKGRYIKGLQKCIYEEHRVFLPPNHVLHFFGQSDLGLPFDYNIIDPSKKKSSPMLSSSDQQAPDRIIQLPSQAPDQVPRLKSPRFHQTLFSIAQADAESVTKWFNSDYSVEMFRDFLYYSEYNTLPWKHRLESRSHVEFVQLGITAAKFLANRRTSLWQKGKTTIPDSKLKNQPQDGINDLSPFLLLPYFDMTESASWDPFHIFKDTLLYLIEIFKGERGSEPNIRVFCYEQQIHPYLWSSDNQSSSDEKTPDAEILRRHTTYLPRFRR